MIQSQSFAFKNEGNVKGGLFTYTANTDTGEVDYSGNVTAKLGFISHSIDIPQGKLTVDPKCFLSSAFKIPGDTVSLQGVNFIAIAVQPGMTTVKVEIPGGNVSNASAVLDTTGVYFKLVKIIGHVTYSIFSTDVEANEVTPQLVAESEMEERWYAPFIEAWELIKNG